MDLHTEMRPTELSQVKGHEPQKRVLKAWIDQNQIPHVVLFIAETGTGKTTLARILASHLGRVKGDSDFIDINCAQDRGIDMARELSDDLIYGPLDGGNRIFILDECCQLPTQTQQALLTTLEEPPLWAYFFLCTTPAKLLPAFRGRCKVIELQRLSVEALKEICVEVQIAHSVELTDSMIQSICASSEGSARKCLSLLEKCIVVNESDGKKLLDKGFDEASPEVIDLVRAIADTKTNWTRLSQMLAKSTQSPEAVRKVGRAYANKMLLNGNARGAAMLAAFQYEFADTGDLTYACWKLTQKPIEVKNPS
jgi:DNA polymerase-3 subunit gamma/tau